MPTVWGEKIDDRTLRIYVKHAGKLDAFSKTDRLRINVELDRHGKFNSLYHVMLSLVVTAVNRGPSNTDINALKRWVKLKNGWYDVIQLPTPTLDGQNIAVEYKSTSFAAMGEEEFHQFAVDTCKLIQEELAPWIKDSPEWQEIHQIVSSMQPAQKG